MSHDRPNKTNICTNTRRDKVYIYIYMYSIASKYLLAWQAEDGCKRVLEGSGQAIRARGEKGDYTFTEQSRGIAGHGDAAALWGSHGQRDGENGPTSAWEWKYGGDEGPEPAEVHDPGRRWTRYRSTSRGCHRRDHGLSHPTLWDSNTVKAADADGLPCVPLASGWSGGQDGGISCIGMLDFVARNGRATNFAESVVVHSRAFDSPGRRFALSARLFAGIDRHWSFWVFEGFGFCLLDRSNPYNIRRPPFFPAAEICAGPLEWPFLDRARWQAFLCAAPAACSSAPCAHLMHDGLEYLGEGSDRIEVCLDSPSLGLQASCTCASCEPRIVVRTGHKLGTYPFADSPEDETDLRDQRALTDQVEPLPMLMQPIQPSHRVVDAGGQQGLIRALPDLYSTTLHPTLPYDSFSFLGDEPWAPLDALIRAALQACAEHLLAFIRSAVLFFLLSTFHLFARTCHLQKGQEKRNKLQVRLRKSLQGAPVICALCVVAYLLPVAAAGRSNGEVCAVSRVTEGPAESGASVEEDQTRHAASTGQSPSFQRHAGWLDRPLIGSWEPDVKFAVGLFRFQQPVYFFDVWSSDAQVEEELSALILEEQVGTAGQVQVIPAWPQPRGGAATYLVAEVWNLALLRCPVLLQVYAGPIHSFIEYFIGPVTFQDVRFSAGSLWPPGGKIYVGDSLGPLDEDDSFNPCTGLLVRITPPSLIPGVSVPLQTCLDSPNEWFTDVEVHGLPAVQDGSGKICVLGYDIDQQVCNVSCSTTVAGLREHVAEGCGSLPHEALLCAPRNQVISFATRGVPVRSVIGLIPPVLQACLGVFVDARSLACKLQFVLLPNFPTKLDRILHLIGATRPDGWTLTVSGALVFDPTTDTLILEHAALLRISVCQSHVAARGEERTDTSADVSRATGEDTPTFGRSDLSFNRRRCTETAESSSGGRSRHDGQALLPLACTHGSDIAFCGEGFTASKAQPIATFSSRDSALQPAALLDAPEFLDPPTFFEDRMSAAPAGNAEQEDSPSPEASFRRVRCCLLRFQARPQFCTLWAAAHEDVLAFTSRASIIINPAPQSFNVVLADPQPIDSLLAFLLVPTWWVSSGITPFTVTATIPDVPFYHQVAREQEDFEDWIPTTALRSFGTLIAQLYEGRSNTRIREDPFPCVGSLLVAMCRGGEDSEIVSAQQVLDLLPHVPAEDATLYAALPDRNDVLLLGAAFEQSLVRMPIGVLDDEVAAFAGIEQEPYHVHWLTDFFEDLAYEGHSVDRCVACRPAAFRSRRPEACGLFIDGRLLGRPVCYRSSHTPLLEAGDLLRLIDADLPSGFELRVIGGTATFDPDVFRFEDGARVVLWAASLAAAGATEAAATEVADHSPVPDSVGSPCDGPVALGEVLGGATVRALL